MTQNFIDDMDISTLAELMAWFLPETISFPEPGQSQLNVVKGHQQDIGSQRDRRWGWSMGE